MNEETRQKKNIGICIIRKSENTTMNLPKLNLTVLMLLSHKMIYIFCAQGYIS